MYSKRNYFLRETKAYDCQIFCLFFISTISTKWWEKEKKEKIVDKIHMIKIIWKACLTTDAAEMLTEDNVLIFLEII